MEKAKETKHVTNTENEEITNAEEKVSDAPKTEHQENFFAGITAWSWEDYWQIIVGLQDYGLKRIKDRDEYTLFKEIISTNSTEVSESGKGNHPEAPLKSRLSDSGVISSWGSLITLNDTTSKKYDKPFLASLDIQKSESIADVISSFRVIQ